MDQLVAHTHLSLAPDSVPASSFSATLRFDLTRLARELQLQQLRATLVDLPMLSMQSGWSMAAGGEFVAVAPSERKAESVFPGAAEQVRGLVEANPDHTLVRKLSPRLWVFAWRLDELHAALVETQFLERHDSVGDHDIHLVRALCTTLISTSGGSTADGGAVPMVEAEQVWPQVDRRARVRPPVPAWLPPLLLGCTLLAAAWLALLALPAALDNAAAQRVELQRLRGNAETTIAHGLAVALATDDYGEVQTALSLYESQGWLRNAAVTNTRQRVVAVVGSGERLRIGDPPTPGYASRAQAVDLRLGADSLGRLLRVDVEAAPAAAAAGAGSAAVLTLMGLLACLGVAAFGWLRGRRG